MVKMIDQYENKIGIRDKEKSQSSGTVFVHNLLFLLSIQIEKMKDEMDILFGKSLPQNSKTITRNRESIFASTKFVKKTLRAKLQL